MKRLWFGISALFLFALLLAGSRVVSASSGEPKFIVSQSGAASFVIIDSETGAWEQLSTRPTAEGSITVYRGRFGEDGVRATEVRVGP
jgi:hypothetical protein